MDARLIALMMTVASLCACTKVQPPPEPQATPIPTPHPAESATERAIQLYPDLAVKGSLFNRTFREVFEQEQKVNPRSLTRLEWPIDIAMRTAGILGVPQAPAVTPAPKVIYVTPDTPKPGTMLDRPAQREHYYVRGTPEYRRVYPQQ